MPLFEVAILERPTANEVKSGKVEKLVFGPKPVVAKDPQSAGIAAIMKDQSEKPDINFDRCEVLVRPFA